MSRNLARRSLLLVGRLRTCQPLHNDQQRRYAKLKRAPQIRRLQWEQKGRTVEPELLEAQKKFESYQTGEGREDLSQLVRLTAAESPKRMIELCRAAAVDLTDPRLESARMFVAMFDSLVHYRLYEKRVSMDKFYENTYLFGRKGGTVCSFDSSRC